MNLCGLSSTKLPTKAVLASTTNCKLRTPLLSYQHNTNKDIDQVSYRLVAQASTMVTHLESGNVCCCAEDGQTLVVPVKLPFGLS